MAFIAVSGFEPTQGKLLEAQALLKEAAEIISGLGAKAQVASLVRGGVPNSLSVILEYDDSEAYGAGLDALYADQGMQGYIARAVASEAMTPVRAVDYAEIPGTEVANADIASAGVIMATLFQIRDGQQQISLERIQRSKALVEKHGAKCRALSSISSDPFGVTATVNYYENFTAWGKIGASLSADPEWQAFGAEIRGEGASSDFLRTSLMRVI
jgi:hypothetical protein